MPMSKPLDFAALRRWFAVLRVLSLVGGFVLACSLLALAHYLFLTH